MKTSTTARLAAVCAAAFITLVLFDGVASLARPHDTPVADTLAMAKVHTPALRSGRP